MIRMVTAIDAINQALGILCVYDRENLPPLREWNMRLSSMLATAVLITTIGSVLPAPVFAFGSEPFVAPEGRDLPLGARRWVGRGECTGQSTMCDDPYAYRYVRRAWYPGYNSGYWVPAEDMRNRYRYSYTGPKYRYHPAWGRDKELLQHHDHRAGVPLK